MDKIFRIGNVAVGFLVMAMVLEALSLAPIYKYGYTDKYGKVLIQPTYQRASNFSEGLAAVAIKGDGGLKYGYIDKSDKFIIKPRYDGVQDFSENLAAVDLGGCRGFIDKTGKVVIKARFKAGKQLCKFVNGLAPVCTVDKSLFGYIQKDGELKIPDKYEKALPFSEGLAAVKLGGKWGYIDTLGKFVIQPEFTNAQDFTDGLAAVSVSGKSDYYPFPPLTFFKAALSEHWGYIDKGGKLVIKPTFVYAWPYSEGLACVINNDSLHGDQFYYIDRHGTKAIDRKILRGKPFSEGLAAVYLPGTLHWCFIDKTGEIVQTDADMLFSPSEGLAAFGIQNKP
jgi:hypothetical protein